MDPLKSFCRAIIGTAIGLILAKQLGLEAGIGPIIVMFIYGFAYCLAHKD